MQFLYIACQATNLTHISRTPYFIFNAFITCIPGFLGLRNLKPLSHIPLALQFLYIACQATNFAQVSLPELHRWAARPGFFDDVTRHVSTSAPSPLTLFDSGGIAEPDPEAIKGQGRRLVGMITRGLRELSNEGVRRLVEEWREVCRSDTGFLRQVRGSRKFGLIDKSC